MHAMFSIRQIVNMTAYEDDAFESIDGWALLDPLPVTLNNRQSLTSA